MSFGEKENMRRNSLGVVYENMAVFRAVVGFAAFFLSSDVVPCVAYEKVFSGKLFPKDDEFPSDAVVQEERLIVSMEKERYFRDTAGPKSVSECRIRREAFFLIHGVLLVGNGMYGVMEGSDAVKKKDFDEYHEYSDDEYGRDMHVRK